MPVWLIDILQGIELLMDIVLFALMGIDKRRAQNNQRRIPENVLWICAGLGGAPGGGVGMFFFHHKTRRPLFFFGFPLLAVCDCIINTKLLILTIAAQ